MRSDGSVVGRHPRAAAFRECTYVDGFPDGPLADEAFDAHLALVDSDDPFVGGFLMTLPDFGCVQWEAKE